MSKSHWKAVTTMTHKLVANLVNPLYFILSLTKVKYLCKWVGKERRKLLLCR